MPDAADAPGDARKAASELRRAQRERRRYERAEVRRFTRRARRRRIAWLSAAAVAFAFAVVIAAAVFSPLFALRSIEVIGTERLSAQEVRAAVDGQLGTPLALLDEQRIREELAGFPLIRSFVTETVPPSTFVIRITEREPVGVVPADGGFELVDPAGVTIETVTERPDGMPLIQASDRDRDGTAFRSIGQVLLELPPALAARVDSITASTRDDVTLVLRDSEQRVVWGGAERAAYKAELLAALVELHGADGPGQYDVSAPETAVFRPD